MALSSGDLALVVIGSVIGLILFLVLVYLVLRKQRNREHSGPRRKHLHSGNSIGGLQRDFSKSRSLPPEAKSFAFVSPFTSDHQDPLNASSSSNVDVTLGTASLIPSEFAESEAGGGWNNPLFEDEFDNFVIQNPVFDEEIRRQRSLIVALQANIRRHQQRQRYVRIRTAIIRFQALWRGFWARKKVIPRIRGRYQALKDQRREYVGSEHDPINKNPFQSTKPGGLLKELSAFKVRFIGVAIVNKRAGVEVVQDAIRIIKEKVDRSQRRLIRLSISVHGVKMVHHTRWAILATVPIQSITFCTTDPNERRLFAFISRYKKHRSKCYVFFCIYNDAPVISLTLAEAFHRCHQYEKRKEHNTPDTQTGEAAEEHDKSVSLDRLSSVRKSPGMEHHNPQQSKTLPTPDRRASMANNTELDVHQEFDAIAAEYDEMLGVLDDVMRPGHLKLACLHEKQLSSSVADLLEESNPTEEGTGQDENDDFFANIDAQLGSMMDLLADDNLA